jgi:hypothetical protein
MAVKITTPEGIITFYNTHVRGREGRREQRERERERGREKSTPIILPFLSPPDQWKSLPRKPTI